MKREDMKREDDDPMRDSPRGKSRQTADMTGTGLRLELIGMTPPRVPLAPWGLLIITGGYFVAGKIGLVLAAVHPSASAVWPPTGIALAATLLLGYRVWPALFLGAFLVNVTTAGSVWTSLGIAGGNTLEGLLAAFLVRRFANGLKVFDRAWDIATFGVLAGLGATAVSATVGVTTLSLGGYASWEGLGAIWLTWWLGDVAGALVVAPVLILWGLDRTVRLTRAQVLELLLLLGSVLLVGEVVFGGPASPRSWSPPTTRSSARRWTGSSRPGTRAPSGSTGTRRARSWGARSRSSSRRRSGMSCRRSSTGSRGASGWSTTRRCGWRGTGGGSRCPSQCRRRWTRRGGLSARRRSPGTSPAARRPRRRCGSGTPSGTSRASPRRPRTRSTIRWRWSWVRPNYSTRRSTRRARNERKRSSRPPGASRRSSVA